MEQVQIRTDLALEARESVSEKEEHLHGKGNGNLCDTGGS